MPNQIPDPEYLDEQVDGAVYTLPGGTILVTGKPPTDLAEIVPLLFGTIVVRYGIPSYIPAGEALIPGLFAAEKAEYWLDAKRGISYSRIL
ncbi:MAG: hypothetical protein ABI947_01525 [Chloroflexota bacterium]